ncbi:MAG TPA: ABC transporter ATP-binding protein, partial [Trueperaceae bacterium]
HVTTGYGPVEVLFNIDLKIFPQELVAVLGSNGAGKTTLLGAISGLLDVRQGDVFYQGSRITPSQIESRVRKGITLVPEGRMLFSGLTVAENLLLGGYSLPTARRAELLASVYEIFPDLAERRSQLAGTLSGGQQQMVAIGRGLMGDPKLLLIDEFSWGLAPALVETILEALAELHKATGLTILIVEQDIRVGLYLADRGYVLENGRVVLADESRSLLANPKVREAYLGL